MGQPIDLVIRNGYLERADAVMDIGIDDGDIESIESSIEADGICELDASGGLVSPGFVDAHFHTDMAFAAAGERHPNYNEQTYSRKELVGKS